MALSALDQEVGVRPSTGLPVTHSVSDSFRAGSLVSVRVVVRPFGYLAFVMALMTLSGAAWLLGDRHELGFFSDRLARTLWRYPEVTRRGVQIAWLTWVLLFAVALSPLDPLATRWDEVVLVALALIGVRFHFGARRVEH
jgi:hypothetical protein